MLPATVEYDVRLTNDSIALRRGADYGYHLAEHAKASHTIANTTASASSTTEWQPRQDRILALTPTKLYPALSMWARVFPLLYEPTQVNLTLTRPNVVQFDRYIDCVPVGSPGSYGPGASNTSCLLSQRTQRRDLAQEYAVQSGSYSIWTEKAAYDGQCFVHWRDPMQVRDAASDLQLRSEFY